MRLDEILSKAGKNKSRKRIGRGGRRGNTSGRGNKGAGQRAGSKSLFGHEGGQNPALARLPKRGFNNANFRTEYQVVNVSALDVFNDGDQVDVEALAGKGLVRPGGGPVKILGDGEIGKKLTVVADAFSASACERIEAAGGSVQRVS